MANQDLKVELLSGDPGEYDLSFKVIVIGDSGVGKSCLTLKATKDRFDSVYSPTVGFEFLTLFLKIEDANIKLQIWDTCGQEVYRSLISSFYHNSSLAILVYAIDDNNSFQDLSSWLNEIKSQGNPDINIFLVGNKVDLEDKREITKERAEEFAKINNFKFFIETSAKTGFNAKNVFIEAAKLLYLQHLEYKDRLTRPDSIANLIIRDSSKNILMDPIEEEENTNGKRKNGCCK